MDGMAGSHDAKTQPGLPLPAGEMPLRAAGRRVEEVMADEVSTPVALSMRDMSAILNTTSSPVSPGQSSPEREQPKPADFIPPARPSSTPFSHPENRNPHTYSLDDRDVDCQSVLSDMAPTVAHDEARGDEPVLGQLLATQFQQLPLEVHEGIIDHLFGFCISPTSSSAMKISSLSKCWATALRHSRRRELSDLALVNRRWTFLIQQRLYRHIKLKATVDYIEDAIMHFSCHPHLAAYVKHVEVWFPVFQPRYGPPATSNTLALPTVTSSGLTNATYILPDNNCTLDEMFRFVTLALPEAQVLTLEGGERRKAPKVAHFDKRDLPQGPANTLHPIHSVRTLITRGQWNLMRDNDDFARVLRALPNLEEWQGSYSKPKSKSYITVSDYIPFLPFSVKRLGLCMENDYRREAITPSFYSKVAMRTHICVSLGQILPRLEHFSYTGRLCHKSFDLALRLSDPLRSKLRSIDVTIKNCCRDPDAATRYNGTGSGIHEMSFIEAFERLVISAIRLLAKHPQLQYLRIRFVDLDSLLPPLNPYFLLAEGKCTGVWSDAIVTEMAKVRPRATFAELCDNFGNIVYSKEGRMVISPECPRGRVLSLKICNYQALANRMTIQ
ncbi:hypothetical protein JDV02_009029 [Purpureocillium takamizusanense]|uniref:Uncharacterized protein n=1 Tax=Purpureocillium takamizusanense TaxID=2060973 RepID=A0A9Q8VDV2_9HYPO|nr:uncharacterized protein JDV02_009029 [Purpureocillium takamizusanense]UNI23195.1 hypothetical protein JDV02_009029 [Purpureocillium takamizusanense]